MHLLRLSSVTIIQIMNHHVYFVETVENRDQCIPSKPGTTFAYSTMAKAVGDLQNARVAHKVGDRIA